MLNRRRIEQHEAKQREVVEESKLRVEAMHQKREKRFNFLYDTVFQVREQAAEGRRAAPRNILNILFCCGAGRADVIVSDTCVWLPVWGLGFQMRVGRAQAR